MTKIAKEAAGNLHTKLSSLYRNLGGTALATAGYGTAAVKGSKDKEKGKDKSGIGTAMAVGATGSTAGTAFNLKTTSGGKELLKSLSRSPHRSAILGGVTGVAAASGALLGAGAYGLGRVVTKEKKAHFLKKVIK